MDRDKIKEIAENAKDKPNKVLIESRDMLADEFDKTKILILELTRHLNNVEKYYDMINKEIGKRLIK